MRTLIVFLALAAASAITPLRAADCDRECLKGFITQYLDAMIAHNPGKLTVAPDVKFTEDTVKMQLGEGLWKTATKLDAFRQDYIDVRQGIAASHVKLEEGTTPTLFTLRLKVVDKKITEVETMVVHNQKEGMIFEVNAIQTASKAMGVVPEASQRNTREEMIRIASLYPGGLKVGSFVKVDAPFASDAYRFENGRLMAGPGCTFIAGCADIKNQRLPTLAGITFKVTAVDEEMGIVLLRQDFGPGSVMGASGSIATFEAFKVYGGQIHVVEAFMKVMPVGTPSGWDN